MLQRINVITDKTYKYYEIHTQQSYDILKDIGELINPHEMLGKIISYDEQKINQTNEKNLVELTESDSD
jgi:hypothetical protein